MLRERKKTDFFKHFLRWSLDAAAVQCKNIEHDQVFPLKWSLPSVVQGYHELYELQRGRLEAQLLQMTEERDYWSQLTFCLALKVCEP